MLLQAQDIDNHPIILPLSILQTQTIQTDQGPQHQLLVQWQDFTPEDSTWILFQEFKDTYQEFDLGTRSSRRTSNIDTNPATTNKRRSPQTRKEPTWHRDYVTHLLEPHVVRVYVQQVIL